MESKQLRKITNAYIKTFKRSDIPGLTQASFDKYIGDCGGIDNLRKCDLDRILLESNQQAKYMEGFKSAFDYVNNRDSNIKSTALSKWALIVAIFTLVVAVITLIITINKP